MKRLFALLAALILLGGCAGREPVTKNGFLLDTFVTITLYEGGSSEVLDEAFELCGQYERIFSRTLPESEVYALNHAGGKPVVVSEDTRAVIERALYYSELTGGRYDITICPVVDLWDFHGDKPALPDPGELEAALGMVNWRSVVVEGDTIRLENGAQIDLGSIAKGYIADRIADFLREKGVESAIVDLGGNIVTVGGRPDGEPFRIGIQRPFEQQNVTVGTVESVNSSIVSSGVYERYFKLDGRLYHHILDTDTGYPAQTGISGVTILSEDSADGDALSTCSFLLGPDETLELIDSLPGIEAVIIREDGELLFSSGFGDKLRFTPADGG